HRVRTDTGKLVSGWRAGREGSVATAHPQGPGDGGHSAVVQDRQAIAFDVDAEAQQVQSHPRAVPGRLAHQEEALAATAAGDRIQKRALRPRRQRATLDLRVQLSEHLARLELHILQHVVSEDLVRTVPAPPDVIAHGGPWRLRLNRRLDENTQLPLDGR